MINALGNWLKYHFLQKRMNTPIGWMVSAVLATLIALMVWQAGLLGGGAVLGGILGIIGVGAIIYDLRVGLYLCLLMAVLIPLLSKITNLPFGLSIDGFLLLMIGGLFMRLVRERDLSFAKSPLTLPIFVWVGYNLIQVLNPVAESQMAWAFTVRSMAMMILLYFIACYALDSYKKIIHIFKYMLLLAFLAGAYGIKQEWFGFAQFELDWLYADPVRFQLIFQWSRLRVFSTFSDPTVFGVYMSYMAVICLVMIMAPIANWKRFLLFFAACTMLLGMAYGGSRTPVVMFPFGLGVFTLLTLRRDVMLTMAVVGMLGAVFVLKSTSSAVIYRVQSAFYSDRNQDTMGVRFENQKKIKPFIQSHPFGAGLGSTGDWGKRFSPHHFLANFPPDSGYVRIAVELGWIGYLIYCWLLFTIARTGIYYYLRCQHPKVKAIYLALICMVFMLILASYVQEAIIAIPNSVNFYICLAILTRLYQFEEEVDA